MTLLFVLHLVGAALWVGGMAFGILAMRPALATLPAPQRLEASAAAHRRFFLLVWHVMPVMLATGYALLFGWFGGFAGVGWHVHVMNLTGLLMSVVFLAVFFSPWRRMRAALAAGQTAEAAAANDKVRQLVMANLVLGLLTVVVAGWGRFGG